MVVQRNLAWIAALLIVGEAVCTDRMFAGDPPALTPTPAPAPVAAAIERSLTLCLAAAADFSPIQATESFPAAGKEVVAVFQLGDKETADSIEHVWIAVDVGEVAPPNYEIARGTVALGNQRRGLLRYEQDVALPVGRYRMDTFADGKPWLSRTFEVAADPAIAPLARPAELLPLAEGATWTYEFTQEVGEGVTLELPAGVEKDAQGRAKARVTMRAGKESTDGREVQLERGGATLSREWWRVDVAGLVATKRENGGSTIRLDPPQRLVALPLAPTTNWNYVASDGSISQQYRMWCARPIESPLGSQAGMVVVTSQTTGAERVTAERQWVAGVGLVREIIIVAAGGKLVRRQELSLVSMSK